MITSQQFRANFPEFSSTAKYSPSLVDFWLSAAYSFLNAGRWGNQLDIGAQLFAGHHIYVGYLNSKNATGSNSSGGNTGPMESKEVGPVKISYASSLASVKGAGHWNLSNYGTRFMWLVDMFGAGPIQIPSIDAPLFNEWAWPGPNTLPGFTSFG